MALKGEREVLATNIYFSAADTLDMDRGIVLVAHATLDGKADIPVGLGTLAQHPVTLRPVGLLMDDVDKDLDFTTRPQVFVRNVVSGGSEISLLTKGRVKTNKVVSGVLSSVVAGEKAYLANDGEVTNVAGSGLVVGHFESAADADNYVRLWVDIEGA
jgi:hypothetical protein